MNPPFTTGPSPSFSESRPLLQPRGALEDYIVQKLREDDEANRKPPEYMKMIADRWPVSPAPLEQRGLPYVHSGSYIYHRRDTNNKEGTHCADGGCSEASARTINPPGWMTRDGRVHAHVQSRTCKRRDTATKRRGGSKQTQTSKRDTVGMRNSPVHRHRD